MNESRKRTKINANDIRLWLLAIYTEQQMVENNLGEKKRRRIIIITSHQISQYDFLVFIFNCI